MRAALVLALLAAMAGGAAAGAAAAQSGDCAHTGSWRDASSAYARIGACASLYVESRPGQAVWSLRGDALAPTAQALRVELCSPAGWDQECATTECLPAVCYVATGTRTASRLATQPVCASVTVRDGATRLAHVAACAPT